VHPNQTAILFRQLHRLRGHFLHDEENLRLRELAVVLGKQIEEGTRLAELAQDVHVETITLLAEGSVYQLHDVFMVA